MKTIDTLDNRPFRHLITTIGALPTSFIDSMSYYEMLAWLCEYLEKTVIPAVNDNAEALKELQEAFVELKEYVDTYFENLDVQTEINNKLDEMAESGTLEEIMADYLNSKAVFGFSTVADMKAAENLIDGSFAKTMGYASANDGGMAQYRVRPVTNDDVVDEKFIIALSDNQLVAELVTEGDVVNVLCIGGAGNNVAQAANYLIAKGYKVYIPRGIYTATETINVNVNDSEIISDGDITCGADVSPLFNVISYRNVIKLNGTHRGYSESDVFVPDFMHIGGDGRSSNYNNIYVHRVTDFNNGFLLMPDGGYGVAWNTLNFDLVHTTYGIVLNTGDTGANYINENTYNGGRLECEYGIKFIKGANQTDPYNANRFYNIAIDGTVTYGIDIDFAQFNFFEKIRLSEGLQSGGKYIKCGTDAHENHFQSEAMIRPNQLEDTSTNQNYRNYYNMKLRDNDGNFIASNFYTVAGTIVTPAYACMQLDKSYINGYGRENSTYVSLPQFYCDGMVVRVGNSNQNRNVVYNLPEVFNKKGVKEFVLLIQYREANTTISLYQNDGTTLIANDSSFNPATKISGAGKMYLIKYTGKSGHSSVVSEWQVIPMNV